VVKIIKDSEKTYKLKSFIKNHNNKKLSRFKNYN